MRMSEWVRVLKKKGETIWEDLGMMGERTSFGDMCEKDSIYGECVCGRVQGLFHLLPSPFLPSSRPQALQPPPPYVRVLVHPSPNNPWILLERLELMCCFLLLRMLFQGKFIICYELGKIFS